jgi:hypothetical protein
MSEEEREFEIATRHEALALLTAKARAGSVSAAIALERALRLDGEEEEPDDVHDELERILLSARDERERGSN